MKKILGLLTMLALIFSAEKIEAQEFFSGSSPIIGVGLGSGHPYYSPVGYGGWERNRGAAIRVTLEKPVKKIKYGNLTLGASLGFAHSSRAYRFSSPPRNYYYHRYNMMSLGLRGAWHYGFEIPNLDVYLGATVGGAFTTYNYEFNPSPSPSFHLFGGPFVGVGYAIDPSINIFLEAGADVAYGILGVHFKL